MPKPTLAIIGSGWAGYELSQLASLSRYNVSVISPLRTIQYTPLLASAACGLFNFRLAEEPVRRKHRPGLQYIRATADSIDLTTRKISCTAVGLSGQGKPSAFEFPYDKIAIAPGCGIQTFGTPGAAEHALFLKTTQDARAIQSRLLDMLDEASLPNTSEQRRKDLLNVRIVGGGAIGIEATAEIYDLWAEELSKLYPHLANDLTITIHDVAPDILTTFDKRLGKYAHDSLLKRRGLSLKTQSHIEKVEADAIYTKEDGRLPYGLLIWATGNSGNPLLDHLACKKPAKGLPRILTDDYLRVLDPKGMPIPDAYALGDAADIEGQTMPTLASVALQKSEYLASVLNAADSSAAAVQPFRYKQRAALAYLGKHDGVIGGREEWTGPAAWLAWRSGSLLWTRSWRRKVFILLNWIMNRIGGREIARN
ncbi:MAG: hypothetical protein M1819_005521 [Sarea resinae]|nr:MAG: hypothetical protein M1819_005521 [Sarea resinae]